MDLYCLKTFFGGLIGGEGEWITVIFGEFLPWVKTEGKICWTYKRGKTFVVKVKRMWKDSKFKDFILFV